MLFHIIIGINDSIFIASMYVSTTLHYMQRFLILQCFTDLAWLHCTICWHCVAALVNMHTTRPSVYMRHSQAWHTYRYGPAMAEMLIMSSIPGQLLLVPRSGTILGGTPVRVFGPCVQEPTKIKCVFDTKEVEGKYYPAQGQFVCVTPRFQKSGRVNFTLTFTSNTGEKQTHSSIFSVGKWIHLLNHNGIISWVRHQ